MIVQRVGSTEPVSSGLRVTRDIGAFVFTFLNEGASGTRISVETL